MAENTDIIDPLEKFRRPQKPGSPSGFKRRVYDEFDLLDVHIKCDVDRGFFYGALLAGRSGCNPIEEDELNTIIENYIEEWLSPITLDYYGINSEDDLYVLLTSREFKEQCKKYLKNRHKSTLLSQYNNYIKIGKQEKDKKILEFVTWKKEKFETKKNHSFGKDILIEENKKQKTCT